MEVVHRPDKHTLEVGQRLLGVLWQIESQLRSALPEELVEPDCADGGGAGRVVDVHDGSEGHTHGEDGPGAVEQSGGGDGVLEHHRRFGVLAHQRRVELRGGAFESEHGVVVVVGVDANLAGDRKPALFDIGAEDGPDGLPRVQEGRGREGVHFAGRGQVEGMERVGHDGDGVTCWSEARQLDGQAGPAETVAALGHSGGLCRLDGEALNTAW